MDGHEERSAWTYKQVTRIITSIPEISSWPDFDRLLSRPLARGAKPSWEYACHACQAVGAEWQAAFPAAAAILCLHYSIHLVDDVLDEDANGLQHQLGFGPTFNLATAFQAAAGICLASSSLPSPAQAVMHDELHRAVLGTGYGQYLDAQGPRDEDEYWHVVALKTPPLFRCALIMGAISAGASEQTAASVGRLADHFGEMVQVSDDLGDAMERPAKADWQRRYGCLPILFGRLADHPEQSRFVELADRLLDHLDDQAALEEAQDILVRCGAVSYCAFRIVEAYKKGIDQVASLGLPREDYLIDLLDHLILPLRTLFRRLNLGEIESLVIPTRC